MQAGQCGRKSAHCIVELCTHFAKAGNSLIKETHHGEKSVAREGVKTGRKWQGFDRSCERHIEIGTSMKKPHGRWALADFQSDRV